MSSKIIQIKKRECESQKIRLKYSGAITAEDRRDEQEDFCVSPWLQPWNHGFHESV